MAAINDGMKRTSLSARRAVLGLYIVLAVFLVGLIGRLGYLTIIKGDDYRRLAEDQQYNDSVLSSLRGTIYDSEMNVLAQTASVWRIQINPSKIEDDKEMGVVVDGLSTILELDAVKLREKIEKNKKYGYLIVKNEVEYKQMSAMIQFAKENKVADIIFSEPDTKRYYPDGTLASTVIGFTGTDGNGLYGLEYYYDTSLTGVDGKIFTLRDARANELDSNNKIIYEAKNGENYVLTLNNEVQTVLRSACLTALEDNQADNVYGIVMNTKTAAILGMCNVPDYNSNDPFTISEKAQAEIDALETDEEKNAAYSNAQQLQWKNKAIADFYYPGSVYKVFLVAGAMEEGAIDENTSYTCHGTITVGDRTVKDYNPIGHGAETPLTLLVNSCNTFSVYVGQRMGISLFYKYFEAFGFTEKTGIDLPGEGSPVAGVTYHSPEISFTNSNLVSVSFGQSNQVTPMQVAAAISAVGNGGKLMTPHIVSKTIDDSGNTIRETKPEVKRQVISATTAATVTSYMEEVVKRGTGANAYVAGYHVAGKTGTSEKTGITDTKAYIASFAGFAPADDPEITVVIVIDNPKGARYSGGDIAAPVAGEVFSRILPTMGIEPTYTDSELAKLSEPAPDMVGKTVGEAKAELSGTEHVVRVIGSGDTVVAQSPEAGRTTPANGVIVLYTEDNTEKETALVPDFNGLTVSQANQMAVNRGFNIRISGSSFSTDSVVAYKQEYAEGTELELGSIITVYFRTSGISD